MSEKRKQPSVNIKLEKTPPSQQALAVGSDPPYDVSKDKRQNEAMTQKDTRMLKLEKEEEEEEEESAAMNVGPPSSAASSGGTLSTDSSDSDLESLKIEDQLEDRLSALHLAQDVKEAVRCIMSDSPWMQRYERYERKILKLRRRIQELEQQHAADSDAVVTSETQDKKEEATAPRASAADITEAGGEDAASLRLPRIPGLAAC